MVSTEPLPMCVNQIHYGAVTHGVCLMCDSEYKCHVGPLPASHNPEKVLSWEEGMPQGR
jgi:hypothetical protein